MAEPAKVKGYSTYTGWCGIKGTVLHEGGYETKLSGGEVVKVVSEKTWSGIAVMHSRYVGTLMPVLYESMRHQSIRASRDAIIAQLGRETPLVGRVHLQAYPVRQNCHWSGTLNP
jgi:hypothetical protein